MTVLNSLCFKWALSLRTAGTHVRFTYILPMLAPPAEAANALPRFPTFRAWRDHVLHVADRRDLWPDFWAGNRAVAEAYGLGPDDFEQNLSTFSVFARKPPVFCAYLRERLAEWQARLPAASPGVLCPEASALSDRPVVEGPDEANGVR